MTRSEVKHKRNMARIRVKQRHKAMRAEERALKRAGKRKIKWPSQSKMGMWYIFISCTVVQIYSMIAMWHFADLAPLATLIGATVGEGLTYYAYTAKAKAENTAGGIVYENSLKDEDVKG